MSAPVLWLLAPLGAAIGVLGAWHCRRLVLRAAVDGEAGGLPAQSVGEGLGVWLRGTRRAAAAAFVGAFLALALSAFVLDALPAVVPFAFLSGAFCSGLCGWLGTRTAAAAAPRAARAAKDSLGGALGVILRAGAVTGLAAVGLGLLDICLWFAGLYWLAPRLSPSWTYTLPEITVTMLCLVLGAGLQALLARLAGGIFAGAADVGADVLARTDPGIPEADPRNPAVVAAGVGRNVAGIAALAADLYETHCLAVLGAAVLGAAAFAGRGAELQLAAAVLPAILAGLGVMLSAAWVLAARPGEGSAPRSLRDGLVRGMLAAGAALAVLSGVVVWLALPRQDFGLWGAVVAGLAAGAVVARAAEYGSAPDLGPARAVAAQSAAGPVAGLLEGLAAGLRAVWLPLAGLVVAALAAYSLAGGGADPGMGFYGVGLAAVGMLGVAGMVLTVGACGPIAAGAREAAADGVARERAEVLHGLGSLAAAVGRAMAIGAAGLAALAALPACLEAFRFGLRLNHVSAEMIMAAGSTPLVKKVAEMRLADLLAYFDVSLANPMLLAGALVGALTAFLFAALTLRGAGRAAGRLVEEVRRQWKTIPGLAELKPEARADSAGCVAAVAGTVRRQMLFPGLLAVLVPPAVGLLFGAAGAVGLLAGMLSAALPLAIFMTASGGAWEAARRQIESGRHGGKGSADHKSAMVGKVLGEALRELAGPGLGLLIKLSAVTSVAAAGLTVKFVGAGNLVDRLAALFGSLAR